MDIHEFSALGESTKKAITTWRGLAKKEKDDDLDQDLLTDKLLHI